MRDRFIVRRHTDTCLYARDDLKTLETSSSEDEIDRQKKIFAKILKKTFCSKDQRKECREKFQIPKKPIKIFEVPGLEDDYYHNVMDL